MRTTNVIAIEARIDTLNTGDAPYTVQEIVADIGEVHPYTDEKHRLLKQLVDRLATMAGMG